MIGFQIFDCSENVLADENLTEDDTLRVDHQGDDSFQNPLAAEMFPLKSLLEKQSVPCENPPVSEGKSVMTVQKSEDHHSGDDPRNPFAEEDALLDCLLEKSKQRLMLARETQREFLTQSNSTTGSDLNASAVVYVPIAQEQQSVSSKYLRELAKYCS